MSAYMLMRFNDIHNNFEFRCGRLSPKEFIYSEYRKVKRESIIKHYEKLADMFSCQPERTLKALLKDVHYGDYTSKGWQSNKFWLDFYYSHCETRYCDIKTREEKGQIIEKEKRALAKLAKQYEKAEYTEIMKCGCCGRQGNFDYYVELYNDYDYVCGKCYKQINIINAQISETKYINKLIKTSKKSK